MVAEWTVWWNVFCQKSSHDTWRMGRWIIMMKDPISTSPQLRPYSSHCIPQTSKNFDIIILRYCLAMRNEFVVDNTLKKRKRKKNCQHEFASTLSCLFRTWRRWWFPLARLCFCFWVTAVDPRFISCYYLFQEIWVICSNLKHVLRSFSTKFLCSWVRWRWTSFAATRVTPSSSVKISETFVSGTPRSNSNSWTVSRRVSLIAVFTRSTFSGVLLVEGLPDHGLLSTNSRPS